MRSLSLVFFLSFPAFGGNVLSGLAAASFTGSAQNTIQAVATDASGNIYVAGQTSSLDFAVTNAAQPVIGESRILRSTNLGVTWTHMGLPPSDVNVVVPDPVDPQTIFAVGSAGIYKSVDGGQSWSTVYSTASATALVIDPENHLRLAALSAGALLRSLDGGNTWTIASTTCGASNCAGTLLADPTGSGALIVGVGLWLSRDWGLTFQEIDAGGVGAPTVAAFDPSNPGWIYVDVEAGTAGSLALSKDFGATWTPKASPMISTFSEGLLGLQVDPDQPNVLVATTAQGFYKSSDGANSWTVQGGPEGSGGFSPDGFHPFVLVSHACSPNGGLFAIGSSYGATYHVDFSPDDGVTWQTPELTGVTRVAMGPGCTAYVTRPASTDAFVAKVSADGTVQWATYLGGSDQDAAVAIAVDAQGNVCVTGNTSSPDFPVTAPQFGVPGASAVFVTKYTPDGAVVFSELLGGQSVNNVVAMAVDLSGSVYVAGSTNSANFPLTPGGLFSTIDVPTDYTGFLTKLAADGTLVYSTFLGTLYTLPGAILVDANDEAVVAGIGPAPGLPAPASGNPLAFVVKLNASASAAVSGSYLPAFDSGYPPSALAMDAAGNLLLFGIADSSTATPGAYSSPPSLASCTTIDEDEPEAGGAYLLKLNGSTFAPVYSALLTAPCGIGTGGTSMDPSGNIVLSMETGAGLALQNPLVAGPACEYETSAIAKISADGSSLLYATYLDSCGVPAVAASNGPILASISTLIPGASADVLKLSATSAAPISLNQISNAFSGDASAVTPGGLYSISASGFRPTSIALGFNPSASLPDVLGGVRVLFDGVPAPILQVAPGRVIVAAPTRLTRATPRSASARQTFTAVQISYSGSLSSPVWMPVSASVPGIMTAAQLNPQPSATFADAYAQNQDGTLNSATNPAPLGSTIRLFATGMGAAGPPFIAGAIALSTGSSPDTAPYSTWQTYSFTSPNTPLTVQSVPGFVSSLFQIPMQVPASIESRGQSVGNGVFQVPVGLQFQLALSDYIPPVSNLVDVYVK